MRIISIVVTYDNRWHFLKDVVESVMEDQLVEKLIIVNNASSYNLADKLSEYSKSKYELINLDSNTGSANGFKTGMQHALSKHSPDFLYLLDDDTRIGKETIKNLLDYFDKLGNNKNNALVSLRETRTSYLAATKGKKHEIVPNSFYSFHLFKRFKNIFVIEKEINKNIQIAKLGYAPYGGLLISKELVNKIGFPNPDLFLYSDDTCYTRQINKYGEILLIQSSKLIDLDVSWDQKNIKYNSPLYDLDSPNFRVFYSLRNRVYLEINNTTTNRGIYFLNMFLYLLIHLIINFYKVPKLFAINRYRIILNAVILGIRGDLKKKII